MNEKKLTALKQILSENSIDNGNCIEWKGKINQGYGYFRFLKQTWSAHRAAYFVKYGNIPEEKFICHKCNNKKCINPDHLYAGTPKQNSLDLKNSSYYPEVIRKNIEIRRKNYIKKEHEMKDICAFYTIDQFADILNLHRNTVLKYVNMGFISSIRIGSSSRTYRIPKSEIERIAEFSLEKIIENEIKKRI